MDISQDNIERAEVDKFEQVKAMLDANKKKQQQGKPVRKFNGDEELATIKMPGEKQILTPKQFKEQARELKRCREDVLYFCKKYFKIVSLKDGLTNLVPYPKQEELLRFIQDNNRALVCASRQVGKCVSADTLISIRNKITGEEETISIGDFFDRIRENSKQLQEQVKQGNEVMNNENMS